MPEIQHDEHPHEQLEESNSGSSRKILNSLGIVPVVLIPLGSLLAAAIIGTTGLYYRELGIKPEDLGVNFASIFTSVTIALLDAIGTVGPFLFITPFWRWAVDWFSTLSNPVSRWLGSPPEPGTTKPRKRNRYLRRLLWWVTAFLLFFVMAALDQLSSAIIPLVIAPAAIGLIFLSLYGDELEISWRIPRLPVKWYVVGFSLYLILTIVPTVYIITNEGPDLRTDGAHGGIELNLLDVDAQPVLVHQQLDSPTGSPGMLRLGRAEGTWVLFDPCNQDVFYYPVVDVTLEVIDEVDCGE